jgi:tricorn protease interacting factor F2/3
MPDTIRPLGYKIHLTPYLDRFLFDGRIEILLFAETPATAVTLNVHELAIWKCRWLTATEQRTCPFALDPLSQSLTITLPEATRGEFRLGIEYMGQINDAMAGFYRSRYTKDNHQRFIAVTQFQESDARRALPCMDHPRHKAVFELEMTVPSHLSVIANTEPVKQESLPDNLKRVAFAPTPLMSTYLLFFGVGEFESAQDSEDPRLRVMHLPGLAHTTGRGLEYGRKALSYCEEYYAIPYPLSKLDLIAVPDFAFGAMENWGAITFRENLLLHFAELTSTAGAQRICEIIAHEIAHQWFGNLVTPSDWKYLWLNESFATYFAYGVAAHHYPHWNIWEQFLHDETATALVRDGLCENVAIEIPGDRPMAINVSTAPIIYNKGASILRMIEGHIGPQHYQKGVRGYLHNHRYACASSEDLWAAFESASAEPITAMMRNWIAQAGHPLVTARRRGNTLILSQKRFTYLDKPSNQTWLVPIRIRLFGADALPRSEIALLLAEAQTAIDLPEEAVAYKLNADQTGFYRCAYDDPDNIDALGTLVADDKLFELDRWGLQNDLFAMARQGSVAFDRYLQFVEHYRDEKAYLPLVGIADHLYQAMLVAPPAMRPTIAETGRRLSERFMERVGYQPVAGEPQITALLRDQLLWQAIVWRSAQAAEFATGQFRQLVGGVAVHPDIARAVMQAGAFTQGAAALDWLRGRFESSPSEHERINILMALAAFQEWAPAEEALAFVLEKVPPRNRYMPIVAAAHNPFLQERIWDWYQDKRDILEAFHPLLYERLITGVWPMAGLERAEEVTRFGRHYLKERPDMGDAVRLALENLLIHRRMRHRMMAP